MSYELFPFQETAVNTLMDKFFKSAKHTSVLYSPTGSGKTIMMIALMDRIIANNPNRYDYAFVWLTPGNGDLEEQSWRKSSEKGIEVNSQLLPDALLTGFGANTATFINWELVKNNQKNTALRDGETINLCDAIQKAKNQNIHFVLIIDEEHRDQTPKAQKIIDMFNADKIIRVSATPTTNGDNYDAIRVNDEDVIAQGLITRQIVLNEGVKDDANIANTVYYFLDLADEKRRAVKEAYQTIGKNINPLVLIQFPNESKANKEERNALIDQVVKYLVNDLEQRENDDQPTIARWLSNENINTDQIEQPDNQINYLLMKQAISTGWDAPRAKILVKLRLNTDPNFTLQTIGRIRRMPERRHYDDYNLDNGFIYSDDPKYVADVLDKGAANKLASFELNPTSPDFGLKSIKPNVNSGITNEEVVKQFYGHLVKNYALGQDVVENENILHKNGYNFGTVITQSLLVSNDLAISILDQKFESLNVRIPYNPEVHRLRLLDAEQKIMRLFHVDRPADVHHILVELFGNLAAGIVVPPLLKLKNIELSAFIINNAKQICDDAKKMDTGGFSKQLNLFKEINEGRADVVPFVQPSVEVYAVYNSPKYELLDKNIYLGYSTNNWVKQSEPEREFEKWVQESDLVKWFYRSKDRGEQYFSIAYGAKKEGFYPDYLVQGADGFTYIIETKGADGENIDQYAEQKFNALQEYLKGEWGGNERFAFVRKNTNLNRLMFNNTQWDENVNDSVHWRPLEELFRFLDN